MMSLRSVLKWTVTAGVVAAAGYAGYHWWTGGGAAPGAPEDH